jgi:hypothetical protein
MLNEKKGAIYPTLVPSFAAVHRITQQKGPWGAEWHLVYATRISTISWQGPISSS